MIARPQAHLSQPLRWTVTSGQTVRAALLFLVLLFSPLQAGAQPLPGSGSDAPDKPGPLSAILDAVGSGSRLLIDTIQPGSDRDRAKNPRFNSTESPRHTVMTFLNAMELVDRGFVDIGYERAMQTLPDGASRAQADRLYLVMLRIGPFSPSALPGPKQIEKSGDTRYGVFPSGTTHSWVWEAAQTKPEGQISVVSAEGQWRFSDATFRDLPGLDESLAGLPPKYPEDASGRYFLEVFSPMAERTSLVGLVAFLVTLAVAIGGGFAIARLLKYFGRKADQRDQSFIAHTLRGAGRAGGLVFFAFVFTFAVGFVELGPVLAPLRYEVPRFILLVAVVLFILALIDLVAAYIRQRIEASGEGHYDRMLVTIIRRVLRVVVVTILLLFLLQNILGMNISSLLLGFGVVGLALSLAAQDVVKNLFGAISIYINRPFVIGDYIHFTGEIGTHVGVVQEIELQATKVEILAGDVVTIPNMLFISREVQNLSARGYIRRELDIAIPYRSHPEEIDRAMETLREIFDDEEVRKDAHLTDRPHKPHISFAGFQDSWLNIKCYHYYFMGDAESSIQRDEEYGWFTYLDHCSLVNRKIVELFGERNIEFAFPTQTIDIASDMDADDRSARDEQPEAAK